MQRAGLKNFRTRWSMTWAWLVLLCIVAQATDAGEVISANKRESPEQSSGGTPRTPANPALPVDDDWSRIQQYDHAAHPSRSSQDYGQIIRELRAWKAKAKILMDELYSRKTSGSGSCSCGDKNSLDQKDGSDRTRNHGRQEHRNQPQSKAEHRSQRHKKRAPRNDRSLHGCSAPSRNPDTFLKNSLGKYDFKPFLPCTRTGNGENENYESSVCSKQSKQLKFTSKKLGGKERTPINLDWDFDTRMNSISRGVFVHGVATLREGICFPALAYMEEQKQTELNMESLKSERFTIFQIEQDKERYSEKPDLGDSLDTEWFESVKKLTKSATNVFRKSATKVRDYGKSKLKKLLAKFGMPDLVSCTEGVSPFQALAKCGQEFALWAIKRLMHSLYRKRDKICKDCFRNSKSDEFKFLEGRSASGVNTARTVVQLCTTFFSTLLKRETGQVVIPHTRWSWDPTKYSAGSNCNHELYPNCKNANTHYPEFPFYLSNITVYNTQTNVFWQDDVYNMRPSFGLMNGKTYIADIKAARSPAAAFEVMYNDINRPGQTPFAMRSQEAMHGKGDAPNQDNFFKRMRQGWTKDGGVVVGPGKGFKLLLEHRAYPSKTSMSILCAGTFEATLDMCTTCCCARGFAQARANNMLIYARKDKSKYCESWFMQSVSLFQAYTTIVRGSWIVATQATYGCT